MKSLKCESCDVRIKGNAESFKALAFLNGYQETRTGYLCPLCIQPKRKKHTATIDRTTYYRSEDNE